MTRRENVTARIEGLRSALRLIEEEIVGLSQELLYLPETPEYRDPDHGDDEQRASR